LCGTDWPRRSALDVEELPSRFTILLPGDERTPVGRTQSDHSGPHPRLSGGLDFQEMRRVALTVQAGERNFPFGPPDRHESPTLVSDGVIAHGASIGLPRRAADSLPRHLAVFLVPQDEIYVPLVICLLAIEYG